MLIYQRVDCDSLDVSLVLVLKLGVSYWDIICGMLTVNVTSY